MLSQKVANLRIIDRCWQDENGIRNYHLVGRPCTGAGNLPGHGYMAFMRSNRSAAALRRIVLAVVFGFMSLGHGPLMAFAHARAAPVQHHMISDEQTHANHHPAAGAFHQPMPMTPGMAAACYAVGCFVSLASHTIAVPAASLTPVGKLSPAASRTIVATPVEPADPLHGVQV